MRSPFCIAMAVCVFAAAARAQDESAPERKFAVPVWHPDARWQIERFAGCEAPGHLDGARLEMEYYSAGLLGPLYRGPGAGRYTFGSYDPNSERGHTVAGGARGYLDGPFSRARFGGWDYVVRSQAATSPDQRYHFFTDGYNGHVLRRLDLKEQEVRTLLPDTRGLLGLAVNRDNKLLVLKQGGDLLLLDPDGKTENGPKLRLEEQIKDQWGASLALDEAHDRLYATAYAPKRWYIWYWDLKDGSFHGVLPIAQEGQPQRGRNEPGPFDGVNLYGEGSVLFGPDDTERRFLYAGRVDTWSFFRLDLEERQIWALTAEGGGKGEYGVARFINQGKPSRVPFYGGGRWLDDGSFISKVHSPYIVWRFRRIK